MQLVPFSRKMMLLVGLLALGLGWGQSVWAHGSGGHVHHAKPAKKTKKKATSQKGKKTPAKVVKKAPSSRPAKKGRNAALAKTHYKEGMKWLKKNKPEKAFDMFIKAITADIRHSASHNMLGFLHYRRGALGLAANSFQLAIRFNPKAISPRYNLAAMLVASKQHKRAQLVLLHLLAKSQFHLDSLALMGYSYYQQKKWKKAGIYYGRVLKLRPKNADAHLNSCKVAYQVKNYKKACFHCKQAVQVKPQWKAAHWTLRQLKLRLQGLSKSCK